MAKLFGTRFLGGSTGDVTFRRTKYGVVMTERITHPKNPQTPAQQRGRFIVSHLTAFFTQLKEVLPEAFENKSATLTDTNAFVSANYHNDYPVFLPLRWRKDRGTVLAPYRVTDGYFPAIGATPSGTGYRTDILLGGLVISAATTVAQLSQAIVENNVAFDMGDEVMYLSFRQTVNDLGTPKIRARAYRLRLSDDDMRAVGQLLPCEGFHSNNGYLGQAADGVAEDDGFCWIHYRKTAQHFRISTQYILVPDTTPAERYGTDEALDFALRSTLSTPIPAFVPPTASHAAPPNTTEETDNADEHDTAESQPVEEDRQHEVAGHRKAGPPEAGPLYGIEKFDYLTGWSAWNFLRRSSRSGNWSRSTRATQARMPCLWLPVMSSEMALMP